MEGVLDKCLTPTTEMIINLVEIENAFINTNHPDFVGNADALLNTLAKSPYNKSSSEFHKGTANHSLLDDSKKGLSKSVYIEEEKSTPSRAAAPKKQGGLF